MRKLIVTIMASLLSCSTAFAFWPEAADSSLEIGVGYRQDRLEWETRTGCNYSTYSDYYDYYTSSGFPSFKSKLKWENLNIWQIEARGKYVTCDNLYLRANGDYGWITSGKNKDSDFFNDYYYGSDFRFAHSHSHVKGHVYDARIAAGYQFKLCDNSFAIAPLIGYSWHGQHLHDRHLRQSFYDDTTYDTFTSSYYNYFYTYGYDTYSGHNSSFHTRWNGPFIGFDFEYLFGCGCDWDWEIFGDYEFHWAEYHATADFNLRRDLFDGFRQRARNAWGHVFDIGVKWDFCECWTLAVKGEFQWWWADKGHDRAKIFEASACDVDTKCFVTIPLRNIEWRSYGVSVNLGMVF